MNEEYLSHLWIPDEEVEQLEKTGRKIPEDRGLDFSEHGAALSSGLEKIATAYDHLTSNSLSDEDIIIFKLVLPEGEDIFGNRDIAEKEGFKINAVKDKNHAVASASKSMFQRMRDRVGTYRESGSLKYFQYVENFEPYTADDKEATSLKKYLEDQKDRINIDVQMMFVPNLEADIQERAANRILDRISNLNGQALRKKYHLADGTAVIRAELPIKELRSIADDPVIYRVEQTSFFHISPSTIMNLNSQQMLLDMSINISSLPTVVVLDSGVEFPDELKDLVPVHWQASDVSGKGGPHGTEVASKVSFSHIGLQLTSQYLTPRAKIIDCDIYGAATDVAPEDMSARIQEAVEAFHDVAKIYNFSSNLKTKIEGDELSLLGYQLDSLMKKYGVKFVVSAGNHNLAEHNSTLKEILDDDDARIAEPADAMLAITVGAVAGMDAQNAFSRRNEPTAYTRIGPGFAGYYKPDLVAYGANIDLSKNIIRDPFAFVMLPNGGLGLDSGTSFTAPVVAGDLAEISAIMPNNDVLLAQTMLYNGAEKIWDTAKMPKEEAIYTGYRYGRGLSVPDNCKYSTPYKVSFLRAGTLKKSTKEHVKFLMPDLQASVKGNNTTEITVTCITDAPIDKSKGEQYLGACITASLHKLGKNGQMSTANPNNSDNRGKWDTCNHFTKTFSQFSGGMWEIWLDLFTKWDINDDDEIPYRLVVTIEDLTRTNNIYEAIIQESAGRFQPIETVRLEVR